MRTIILLILYTTLLFAKIETIEKTYNISYGIFSNLGTSKATLSIDTQANTYKAIIEARATGLARVLSNGRYEYYESIGIIQDGLFIPTKFKKISTTNSKNRETLYTFDYEQERIYIKKLRLKDKEIVVQDEEELDYFANNDILSLFFNLKDILPDLQKDTEHTFFAVGNDKNNGLINVLKFENDDLVVYLNQPIFSSKRGELFITLDENGFCEKAILKDVLFFGDIVAK